MTYWTSAHPLPLVIEQHLIRAGFMYRSWDLKMPGDFLIFLSPHWLIQLGSLSFDEITFIYTTLDVVRRGFESQSFKILNGERLLAITPEELTCWSSSSSQALPRAATLAPLPPVEALLAVNLLQYNTRIGETYERLDQLSERGGAEHDSNYFDRLCSIDAISAINSWNQVLSNDRTREDLRLVTLQLCEMDLECQRQFRAAKAEKVRLSFERQTRKRLANQWRQIALKTQRINKLLSRLSSI